jgi:hypothetical protein
VAAPCEDEPPGLLLAGVAVGDWLVARVALGVWLFAVVVVDVPVFVSADCFLCVVVAECFACVDAGCFVPYEGITGEAELVLAVVAAAETFALVFDPLPPQAAAPKASRIEPTTAASTLLV